MRCVGLVEMHDFEVLDYRAWSDEDSCVAFILEVESRRVRGGKVHRGPKVWYHEDVEKFLEKHLKGENVLVGPFVRGDRWYVELKRRYSDIKELLEEEFAKIQMSKDIMDEVRKGFAVYVDDEILEVCKGKPVLGEEIFSFVRKRPVWLK